MMGQLSHLTASHVSEHMGLFGIPCIITLQ
jgi:hypothetical protein